MSIIPPGSSVTISWPMVAMVFVITTGVVVLGVSHVLDSSVIGPAITFLIGSFVPSVGLSRRSGS